VIPHSLALKNPGLISNHGTFPGDSPAISGKDDADLPLPRHKVPELTKNCLIKGNLKTQFISILLSSGGYTAFVLNGNGEDDVHDDDQHTYIGGLVARPTDPDGDAQ
jgi:hypothetical protein